MPKNKASTVEPIPNKNPAAVELGRKGGEETAKRGSNYFRKIAAKRKSFKVQMVHRAYLYSVLKRLKDRDEVIVRRGKYITKMVPKTDAGGAEPNFVH